MKLLINKVTQRGHFEKLGTSSVTIDQYGCYLACITMSENYYGFATDIVSLNNLFIEKGVYMNRNLIDLFKIDRINEFVKGKEYIDCMTVPAPLKKLDNELNEGRPVIVQVDLNPNQTGPDHFILIIGKTEDGHYIAHDPWYADEDAIFFDARYGDPAKGIFGMRFISGPVPKPPVTQPNVSELQGQVEQWKTYADDVKEHLRPVGVMPGDELPTIIGAIDKLVDIKNKYEELLKEKQDQIIPESDEKIIGQFPFGKLIIRIISKKGSE